MSRNTTHTQIKSLIHRFLFFVCICVIGVCAYFICCDDWGLFDDREDSRGVNEEKNVEFACHPQERKVYNTVNKSDSCFIVISKENLSLKVYEPCDKDTVLIAVFPVCLSKNKGQKEEKGDMKTPESTMENPFKVIQIQESSTWHHDFGDGRGSILAYGDWFIRLETGFQGIGIHGSTNNEETVPGRASEGCIRLRNDDLTFLKEKYVFEGMKVVIKKEEEGPLSFETVEYQGDLCNK